MARFVAALSIAALAHWVALAEESDEQCEAGQCDESLDEAALLQHVSSGKVNTSSFLDENGRRRRRRRRKDEQPVCGKYAASVCTGNTNEYCQYSEACKDGEESLCCNAGGKGQECQFCDAGNGLNSDCPPCEFHPTPEPPTPAPPTPTPAPTPAELPCTGVAKAGVCDGNYANMCQFSEACATSGGMIVPDSCCGAGGWAACEYCDDGKTNTGCQPCKAYR